MQVLDHQQEDRHEAGPRHLLRWREYQEAGNYRSHDLRGTATCQGVYKFSSRPLASKEGFRPESKDQDRAALLNLL